jgi:hypothetical protein
VQTTRKKVKRDVFLWFTDFQAKQARKLDLDVGARLELVDHKALQKP